MRHVDLRREASSHSQASLGAVTLYCCVVPAFMGVWARGCVFGGGTSDAMWVQKTCVKLFPPSFPTGGSRRWRISVEKGIFRLYKKARFGLQSKKVVFD